MVPQDKRQKAIKMLQTFSDRKKSMVKELQRLAGFLNFLTKAIVPSRTFLQRMYSKFAGALTGNPIRVGDNKYLQSHHHVKVDEEFRNDCKIWLFFLQENHTVYRPFVDFNITISAKKIQFATDASRNPHLGFGCVYKSSWTYSQWESGYINKYRPSIEYLELYALCVGVLIWGKNLANGRYIIWCDNKSTCAMVNKGSSSCRNCMFLLRILTLDNLRHNRRIFANYISTRSNFLPDALSHLNFLKFRRRACRVMDLLPTALPDSIWPVSKIWVRS